jgi:hypothetical protein
MLTAPELEVVVVVKLRPAPVFRHFEYDLLGKLLQFSLDHVGYSLYPVVRFRPFHLRVFSLTI